MRYQSLVKVKILLQTSRHQKSFATNKQKAQPPYRDHPQIAMTISSALPLQSPSKTLIMINNNSFSISASQKPEKFMMRFETESSTCTFVCKFHCAMAIKRNKISGINIQLNCEANERRRKNRCSWLSGTMLQHKERHT